MRACLLTVVGLAVILLSLIFSAYRVVEFHPYISELLNWTLAIGVGAIAVQEDFPDD